MNAKPGEALVYLDGQQAVLSIEVLWPATGKTQTLTGLQRHRYRVREGDHRARSVDRPSFKLAGL